MAPTGTHDMAGLVRTLLPTGTSPSPRPPATGPDSGSRAAGPDSGSPSGAGSVAPALPPGPTGLGTSAAHIPFGTAAAQHRAGTDALRPPLPTAGQPTAGQATEAVRPPEPGQAVAAGQTPVSAGPSRVGFPTGPTGLGVSAATLGRIGFGAPAAAVRTGEATPAADVRTGFGAPAAAVCTSEATPAADLRTTADEPRREAEETGTDPGRSVTADGCPDTPRPSGSS
ncbi:hypothetical protein [Streptomyces sp. NPDC001155]